MSEEFERDPLEGEPFDPSRISASRVNQLAECGVAFEMKYLLGIPEQVYGTFALFGSVVHRALEQWSPDRSQDLLALMREAWLVETEGDVAQKFVKEYVKISAEVLRAEKVAIDKWEAEARNKGKKSQAPRMTKHFKESDAAKKLNRLLAQWIPKLDRDSKWKFTERDPLPKFYDDSLIIAKRYQRQYGHLLPSLHTEFSFEVPWRGFNLNGHIDVIETLMSPEGELLGLGVIDYKTYRVEPAEQKDYRQLVIYDIAVRELVKQGAIQLPFSLEDTKLFVGIDYVRQTNVESDWKVLLPENAEPGTTSGGKSRAFWQLGELDHERLYRELVAFRNTVEGKNFLPADKGQKADFCDYGELCCQRSCAQAGGSAERVEVAL